MLRIQVKLIEHSQGQPGDTNESVRKTSKLGRNRLRAVSFLLKKKKKKSVVKDLAIPICHLDHSRMAESLFTAQNARVLPIYPEASESSSQAKSQDQPSELIRDRAMRVFIKDITIQ